MQGIEVSVVHFTHEVIKSPPKSNSRGFTAPNPSDREPGNLTDAGSGPVAESDRSHPQTV